MGWLTQPSTDTVTPVKGHVRQPGHMRSPQMPRVRVLIEMPPRTVWGGLQPRADSRVAIMCSHEGAGTKSLFFRGFRAGSSATHPSFTCQAPGLFPWGF